MQVVFGLADRILVLNYGEVIVIGEPEEVRRNPTVTEIYLGRRCSVLRVSGLDAYYGDSHVIQGSISASRRSPEWR